MTFLINKYVTLNLIYKLGLLTKVLVTKIASLGIYFNLLLVVPLYQDKVDDNVLQSWVEIASHNSEEQSAGNYNVDYETEKLYLSFLLINRVGLSLPGPFQGPSKSIGLDDKTRLKKSSFVQGSDDCIQSELRTQSP